MWRQIDGFRAEGDDGTIHRVIVYQRFTRFRSLKGEVKEVTGSRDYKLADGRNLSATDAIGTFRIVQTDEIIQKIRDHNF